MVAISVNSMCRFSAVALLSCLLLIENAHGFIGTGLAPKFALSQASRSTRPLASRLPLGNRLATARSPLAVSMADDAPTEAAPKRKSVLILSWFYAQPKELELVRRIYTKRGYDVEIHESLVEEVARPRGWYNTYRRSVKGDAISQQMQDKIYKEWDVVHAMSGGFLNLALILAPLSKTIKFKKLVLDSTPILPNPVSFVRFARAYMAEHGLNWANKIIPEPLQTAAQTARWSVGAAYARGKHKIGRRVASKKLHGHMPQETVMEMEEWTRWATHNSMLNRYDDMSTRSIESIFNANGLESVTFLFNPEDPYLNQDDVKRCIDFAKDSGKDVNIVHSPCGHIETIFRKPKLLFDVLAAEPAAAAK